MRLHEDKELFEQVLTLTADSMKIDAAIIEKDYFVTMLLQEIARRQPAKHLVTLKTKRAVKIMAARERFKEIKILTPEEVVTDED